MKSLAVLVSSVLLSWAASSGVALADTSTPSAAPGRLDAIEPLKTAWSIPGAGKALAIRYTSTNGVSGEGVVQVTGEVLYPSGPAPKGGWPVVAWAHGTVGIADQCAPSVNPHSARDKVYLGEWLKRGFAVVATDYQGLGGEGVHAYLNTRVEAYSVLDSVRAVLSGLPGLRNEVMIVGQSQGGGAAFAATAWAPQYTPDLHIRGTVATGIPFMTPQVVDALFKAARSQPDKARPAGSVDPTVAYLLLIGAAEAELDPKFDPAAVFTPKAMPAFRQASQICLKNLGEVVRKDGLTPSNAFTADTPKALAPVLKRLMYPTLKLATPLFIGTGTADRDVSPLGQVALAKAACKAGTLVQFHEYPGKDHSATVLASLPDSATFVRTVMSGQTPSSSCAALDAH